MKGSYCVTCKVRYSLCAVQGRIEGYALPLLKSGCGVILIHWVLSNRGEGGKRGEREERDSKRSVITLCWDCVSPLAAPQSDLPQA